MLTLIIGYPNAGKTTFSEKFENVVHFDKYNGKRPQGLAVVADMEDACVEGLFLTRKSRLEILDGRESPKICYWLDTPLEECIKRIGRPSRIVQSCAKQFEQPTYDEGWDKIIVVHMDGTETTKRKVKKKDGDE